MSTVYRRQFREFTRAFREAFAGRCQVEGYRSWRRLSGGPNDRIPHGESGRSRLVSRLYMYHWMPNGQWNGGHLSSLWFRVVHEPGRGRWRFRVLYYLHDLRLECESWFEREVDFNYVGWCARRYIGKGGTTGELLRIVFPFFGGKVLPESMNTPFDGECERFAVGLARGGGSCGDFPEIPGEGEWSRARWESLGGVLGHSLGRTGKASAGEWDARADYLEGFDVRSYLLAHPGSRMIYGQMSGTVWRAALVCRNKANAILDRW